MSCQRHTAGKWSFHIKQTPLIISNKQERMTNKRVTFLTKKSCWVCLNWNLKGLHKKIVIFIFFKCTRDWVPRFPACHFIFYISTWILNINNNSHMVPRTELTYCTIHLAFSGSWIYLISFHSCANHPPVLTFFRCTNWFLIEQTES